MPATAPNQGLTLVERFDRNREAYRSGDYNETRARVEFIDPLFEALGWVDAHDQMVSLVEQMLALHKRLAEVGTGYDKQMIQRQIDATDAQIDRLVYDLYDLTEDEIKIVEEATK